MLLVEQAQLRRKGYRICFAGDFNSHIGNVPGIGIKGNTDRVCPNGHRFLSFLKDAELQVCNNLCRKVDSSCASHDCDLVCSGKWT